MGINENINAQPLANASLIVKCSTNGSFYRHRGSYQIPRHCAGERGRIGMGLWGRPGRNCLEEYQSSEQKIPCNTCYHHDGTLGPRGQGHGNSFELSGEPRTAAQ